MCKRRKIENILCYKRKWTSYDNLDKNVKKKRISPPVPNKHKRLLLVDHIKSNKRQKVEPVIPNCLIHEEKYICDIYECSGVKEFRNYCEHMPYII